MKNESTESEWDRIKRASVEIISEEGLQEKLKKVKEEKRPLRVKMGFDPTAPDIHLGHLIGLKKLRDFQDLGHQVLFLIGDFTAKIGDPSGRNKTRPPLSDAEIQQNAVTYKDQAFKILDPRKTQIVFNSAWCEKLSATDLIQLAGQMNVARMLEREDFKLRYQEGISISIHEFLYPLIQGYDSVAIKADVELGGQDQRFNLLVGRELQKHFGQEPQALILLPLLEGIDGEKKMSKSYGNAIGITEAPESVFTKIMSMPDALMPKYFELLTRIDALEYKAWIKEDPREAKMKLAEYLLDELHSASAAATERERYLKKASGQVSDLEAKPLPLPKDSDEFLFRYLSQSVKPPVFASLSEARRMFEQGGVCVVDDENTTRLSLETKINELENKSVIRVGKKKWFRVQKA
jgi:tyrosyl-tRNA synthetase